LSAGWHENAGEQVVNTRMRGREQNKQQIGKQRMFFDSELF